MDVENAFRKITKTASGRLDEEEVRISLSKDRWYSDYLWVTDILTPALCRNGTGTADRSTCFS